MFRANGVWPRRSAAGAFRWEARVSSDGIYMKTAELLAIIRSYFGHPSKECAEPYPDAGIVRGHFRGLPAVAQAIHSW